MKESVSIIQVDYSDLASFADEKSNASLLKQIEAAYGVDGLGILEITNVPSFEEKRLALLPLAAELPHLPDLDNLVDEKSMYSIGWSHGKEKLTSGKPDKAKGSFYARPFDPTTQNKWPTSTLPNLETALSDMATTLQNVGLLIATVCDAYCEFRGVTESNIAASLRESNNATGRLLHYFAVPEEDVDGTWCAWHNDHGSLTGLVPGMYLNKDREIVPAVPGGGLFIETRTGAQVRVNCKSCAFQLGETAQIQSGGCLRATPHAVRPGRGGDVTRESFALFLQPPPEALLVLPQGCCCSKEDDPLESSPASQLKLSPIRARWKTGDTFGDFHWNTIHMFSVKE